MSPILFALVDAVLEEYVEDASFFCDPAECDTCWGRHMRLGWWRSLWGLL